MSLAHLLTVPHISRKNEGIHIRMPQEQDCHYKGITIKNDGGNTWMAH